MVSPFFDPVASSTITANIYFGGHTAIITSYRVMIKAQILCTKIVVKLLILNGFILTYIMVQELLLFSK